MKMSLVRSGATLAAAWALGGCVVVPIPIKIADAPHFVTMVYPKQANPGPQPASAHCPTPARTSTDTARMVALVNSQRAAHGLPPLHTSAKLTRAAQAHACDNAARVGYSHVGSDGSDLSTRLYRSGYLLSTAAENTGLGFSDSDKMVSYWMNSPGHRANILNAKVTEIGLGQADGARPTWVLDFGRPR